MDLYSILWPIHGILMGASFIFMLAGMGIARYGKQKTWWFKTHRFLGGTGSIVAAAAIILAFVMVGVSHGYHLSNTHGIFGLITILLVLKTPFLGYWMSKQKTQYKKLLRIVHPWVGRVTLLMMAVTSIFGLQLAGIL